MSNLQEEINKQIVVERLKELSTLPILTLGELLEKLEAIEPDYETYDKKIAPKHVYFNYGSLVPTDFDSWRGVYAEIAIGYGLRGYDGDAELTTLADFTQKVRDAIGSTYEGWKGGEYTMNESTPVWIDNSGNYTNTMLVDVQSDKYSVKLIGVQTEDDY